MSALGLVEMTRKRVRESFAETVKEPCHYCRGLGNIKKPTTVCFELFRALEGEFTEEPGESAHVSVHPKVAEELMQEERQALEEVEERLKLTLHVEADPKLHVEQYVIKRDV
jgi:ribonuclease G